MNEAKELMDELKKNYDELMKGYPNDGSALYLLRHEFAIWQVFTNMGDSKEFSDWILKSAKEVPVNITQMPANLHLGYPERRQCFLNSLHAVYNNAKRNVYYCEGFYIISGLPVHHAWNRIGNKYFDLTYNMLKQTKPFLNLPDPKYISVIELKLNKLQLLTTICKHRYGPLMEPVYRNKKIIYGRTRQTPRKVQRAGH